MRLAASAILAISGGLVLGALAFEFGDTGGASHNVVMGIFLGLAAVPLLRNPYSGVLLCGFIAAGALVTVASPFLYEYQAYIISMAVTMWSGLMMTVLAFFIIGEALFLNQPLTEIEEDTAPTARTEPQ